MLEEAGTAVEGVGTAAVEGAGTAVGQGVGTAAVEGAGTAVGQGVGTAAEGVGKAVGRVVDSFEEEGSLDQPFFNSAIENN